MEFNGILLIDKPAGISSHGVVARIRRHLGMRRIGHAGTLDPLATGLLIILVGKATSLSAILTGCDKTYEAIFHLGKSTTTDDGEGEILREFAGDLPSLEKIQALLPYFRGELQQIPPRFCAKKIQGVACYKLARLGKEVPLNPINIAVNEFEITSYESELLGCEISCSKGTYIRSLARDFGAALNCGGFLSFLRRIRCGIFSIDQAISLEKFLQMEESAIAFIMRKLENPSAENVSDSVF